MNRKRTGLYPIILFMLVGLSLAPAGGPALAQAPNEISCIPEYHVYIPIALRTVVISGKLTYQDQPAAGIYLALYRLKSPPEIERIVQTDAQGDYFFSNPPKLSRHSSGYAVVFVNGKNGNADDSRYLTGWMSFPIKSLDEASIPGGNFDIADVSLASPAPGQTVTIPAEFGWAPRVTTSDTYSLNILDDQDHLVFKTDATLGSAGSYTFSALPAGLVLGEQYWWHVEVFAPEGGYGISYRALSTMFGADGEMNSNPIEGSVEHRPTPFEESLIAIVQTAP